MIRSTPTMRDLLTEALSRAADERSDFLAAVCSGNPEMRRELEELIEAFASSKSFLERTPPLIESLTPRRSPSMIGRKLGRYTIRQEIAAGGMGAVYEAVQDQPQRIVALKLMRHGITSRETLRRFEYESQILGRLRHPGIAQVFEAGMHDDGPNGIVPYFVMEFIPDGLPLTRYGQTHELSIRQRLELFAQVCDAVHHGHQKGIIHRDLKPGNILVDSNGTAKIIDYGIARITDCDVFLTAVQTNVGQLVGTLQYMSPEQCAGDVQDLDTRSDVYSLGVVLYELLLERLPYDVSQLPIHEAINQIRDTLPLTPGSTDRAVRGDLETIIMKALEKDRTRRYRSASELGDDIRRFLNRQPIFARPPSVAYQFRMFARRNRALVRSAVAIVVLLVAGIIAVSAQWMRAEAAGDQTNDLAVKAVRLLAAQLGDSVKLADRAGQQTLAIQLIEAAQANLKAADLSRHPEVEEQLLDHLASGYRMIGEFRKSQTEYQRAIELAQSTLGPYHRATLEAKAHLAALYRDMTDHQRAEQQYREVIQLHRDHVPIAKWDVSYWHDFSDMLQDLGRCGEAEPIAREAFELLSHAGWRDTSFHKIHLARIWRDQDRFDEAVQLLQEAIEEAHRTQPHDNQNLHRAQRELARTYLASGRINEASDLQQQAMNGYLQLSRVSPYDIDTMNCIELGAMIDREKGRLSQAERALAEIADRAEQSLFVEPQWWAAHFRVEQAKCLAALGRSEQAEPILLQAYAVLAARLGEDHRRTQNCIRALCELDQWKPESRAKQWKADWEAEGHSAECR